ncbi:hypothetical protein Salat_2658000 [Sesamum alatum]|uniref:CCHC-type domain-containing protein n=1 Tax=Sesamum alatum TaxID=300844 RepID=A0AAE2CB10_9LAMI|nr:hypothetical protein Salat_2658000 [Sesamum alatum]
MEMNDESSWGATMRIRVAIDVTCPLPRALRIQTTLGSEHLVTFTYERLLNFCYLCGRLGHIAKYCEAQYTKVFQDLGEHTPFGPWLRAPPSARGQPRSTMQDTSRGSSQIPSNRQPTVSKASAIFGEFGFSKSRG